MNRVSLVNRDKEKSCYEIRFYCGHKEVYYTPVHSMYRFMKGVRPGEEFRKCFRCKEGLNE